MKQSNKIIMWYYIISRLYRVQFTEISLFTQHLQTARLRLATRRQPAFCKWQLGVEKNNKSGKYEEKHGEERLDEGYVLELDTRI